MTTALSRLGTALGRMLHGPGSVEVLVGPGGPAGDIGVPREGDGVWEVRTVQGRPCITPDERSYYLYFVLPPEFAGRARAGLWVEVEYHGDRFGQFRVQYSSTDLGAEHDGLYEMAEQRWDGEAAGLGRFRRALFPLPDFDPSRTQNLGAAFRVEFRREVLITRVRVSLSPPVDAEAFTRVAPLPELRKMPGRFYPINYLFIEITNACNFKCTWCPDDIMGRRRGFMKKEKTFRILDEIAEKRTWLGPLYPVKLHQMGEPFLHPDLPEIVEHAESRGVGIELNTNCGLITPENIEALYRAGLTNLILSYQTPDLESFRTRKAPRIAFDEYRDKVRLAVERKVALGARTHLEIDIMNTKYADSYSIVSEDEQALAFLQDWISFARELEKRHGLPPRHHDWDQLRSRRFLDQDENGSRYELLDGVHLVWKRCHSWGNVIGEHQVDAEGAAQLQAVASAGAGSGAPPHLAALTRETYCPAPYDQFVVQWNGDVVSCCTDYEGRTKTANVFASSIEEVWKSETLRQRKQDMLEGRLLDVCASCQGLK
ncbi:MAG TPA: radical SAM protein [Vicinamibacteria bacterium]|nr:radical SAM protein [Vicinamibacteria bacterium]